MLLSVINDYNNNFLLNCNLINNCINKMMKEPEKKNHLKNNYLGYIGGPILFTAPHSKKVMRGGKQYGQKKRLHLRQIYTSWLAVQLAHLTKLSKKSPPNSFCVWGKSSRVDEVNLDPNYLLQHMLPKSQFHLILHHWALKHAQTPILHVDIHGKMNRQNNCEVDVGILSIRKHWGKDIILKYFEEYFTKFSTIFQGLKFRQFECKFETNPALHGYWGGSMSTMTEQAIKLGIPSFQLEIPREVRKKLFKDEKLRVLFANGIQQFYKEIIIPYTAKKKEVPLKISKQLALNFQKTIKSESEASQARQQLQIFETKQQANTNVKKI